jgi:hypothetical protein
MAQNERLVHLSYDILQFCCFKQMNFKKFRHVKTSACQCVVLSLSTSLSTQRTGKYPLTSEDYVGQLVKVILESAWLLNLTGMALSNRKKEKKYTCYADLRKLDMKISFTLLQKEIVILF